MILENETKNKFGYFSYDIKKWVNNKTLILQCDYCKKTFERSSLATHMARRNSSSIIDICSDRKCIKWKRENTMVKKFGVVNASQNEEIKKRKKKTCLKNYGTEYILQRKDLMENACLKKYGTKYPSTLEHVKNKSKSTTLQHFGVEYSTQHFDIIEKRRENNLKKYGVISPNQLPNIKRKIKSSWLKRVYKILLNRNDVSPMFEEKDFKGFNLGIDYKFKCNICNNVFKNNYMGVICYKCNPQPRSFIEKEIKGFIENNYTGIILYNSRKPFNNKFEIDCLIPEIKLAIEINGNYYHSELSGQKNKSYHLHKTVICENKDIHLIQILEDEWNVKKDMIKTKLLYLLKESKQKIYARRCLIKPISKIESDTFLNKHHIQGTCVSSIYLGIFNLDNLIGVMTFGKLRSIMGFKNKPPGTYEMIRFATSVSIVGGASKLLTYFIKNYNPKKIISYADRRWTKKNNNVYEKMGFKLVSEGSPNYWYINKRDYQKRYHRFSFRKSILSQKLKTFDPNLTEWENMKLTGYDRIWDCGNLKYELNPSNKLG